MSHLRSLLWIAYEQRLFFPAVSRPYWRNVVVPLSRSTWCACGLLGRPRLLPWSDFDVPKFVFLFKWATKNWCVSPSERVYHVWSLTRILLPWWVWYLPLVLAEPWEQDPPDTVYARVNMVFVGDLRRCWNWLALVLLLPQQCWHHVPYEPQFFPCVFHIFPLFLPSEFITGLAWSLAIKFLKPGRKNLHCNTLWTHCSRAAATTAYREDRNS